MKKVIGFLSGTVCGALIGAAASVLVKPKDSAELSTNFRTEATSRWQTALTDAREEMERTQRTLQAQYDQLSKK